MAIIATNDFDAGFEVVEPYLNTIKGMIVGAYEAPYCDYHTGDYYSVEWRWIARNVPDADYNLNTLLAAGYIWEASVGESDDVVMIGLTHGALTWVAQHLGMPQDLVEIEDPEKLQAWAETAIEPTFVRGGTVNRRLGIKTVSEIVRRKVYTREEAIEADREIAALVEGGAITPQSAAAYRSHITRRLREGNP
ncbi:hypothetical protein [Methylobacterium sp. Leaf466]|uniref:hypothetical protein n=1 Tax=Methylobacterium sp. Leaf466 TaxID=1736386 RepID=UPI0006FDFC9B|nr:hypothetical protein [Methylobacterium sp. Leaf466]KQT82400.1 hypothetical protein ASG59_18580 [Methylobacterium sp. Leaf466]